MFKKYIIAIDGGGTKTLGALADSDGNIVCFRVKGASNPNDIGETASGELLAALVRELADEAEGWIDAIFAGVSGATGHEKALRDAISDACPDTRVKVVSDIYNLFGLLEGDCERDAAALICGTGSVCFVRKNGQLHRVGGWGYLLDRDGGAYSVGRDGIEAALRAYDGRGRCTSLYGRAEEYLGTAPEDAIGRIYHEGKSLVAGFAPYVFRAAEGGDEVASEIVASFMNGTAELLKTAKLKIGRDTLECIVSGGMLRDPFMSRLLAEEIANAGIELLYPVHEQIYGAIAQAMALLK